MIIAYTYFWKCAILCKIEESKGLSKGALQVRRTIQCRCLTKILRKMAISGEKLFESIVGRFLGNNHIMYMAFTHTGCRNFHKAGLFTELFKGAAAGIPHSGL